MKRLVNIFLLVSLFSCSKESVDVEITNTNWIVEKYKLSTENVYIEVTKDYPVTISEESLGIFLDVNSCGGEYTVTSPGKIEIKNLHCTYVCCDSDFALELIRLLPQVDSYSGNRKTLGFKGAEGEIVLKKQ